MLTIIVSIVCGLYLFILGSILDIGIYMIIGLLFYAVALLCSIQHNEDKTKNSIKDIIY